MVECKLKMKKNVNLTITVLIDTWWNVNTDPSKETVEKFIVLIDTWWNVN